MKTIQMPVRRGVAVGLGLWLCLTAAYADVVFERKGPLKPGPDDGYIASATARLLEQEHYLRMSFDDRVSSNFFHRYLDTLDPQHMHFLQSDVEAFQHYESALDDMIGKRGNADTSPGFDIFERFYQRLQQRTEYAKTLLETETFVFEDTTPILLNRREAPLPADLEEARAIWRDRLRYEYLEEKLGLMDQRKADAEKAASKPEEDAAPAQAKPAQSVDEEVKETLIRRYQRNLRFFAEWDSDDVIQLFLSTLAHVYDPHSDYMGRAQMEQFAITMNLALFGIGAQLTSDDGYCTISKLLPGGPAEKSKKLGEKDRIVAVAQADGEPVDVVDMSLNKVVQLIRGPKGSEVHLTVAPPKGSSSTERRVVTLIRDEIPLEDQAAKARLIELPGEGGRGLRLGVIDLPSFYAPMDLSREQKAATRHSTSEDVSLLVEKLKKEGMDGLILDLRRNGGGSLEEAIRLTGLFIEKGPVVQVRNYDNTVHVQSDRDPAVLYDGPMLVLTSRGSASASEIVAGALQDYGRAVVVGDISTHGKGTVQSLNQLRPFLRLLDLASADPGGLKVTIRKFYRANGESTQLRGITPHIVLPSVANSIEEAGEASLKNPLEFDTIPSARFKALNQVNPYLEELKRRSEARVEDSRDYAYIHEDIAKYEEMQKDKTALLNEARRIEEREEAEARRKARVAERKARPTRDHVVYEITLADVNKPGLPEPLSATAGTDDTDSTSPGAHGSDLTEALEESDDQLRIDPVLDEAQSILRDYIRLQVDGKIMTAGTRGES